jgi:hypothetical protein
MIIQIHWEENIMADMTPENRKKYDEKAKRVGDAIALKEPDRVPIMPAPGIYPVKHAGYTMAEVIYDTSLQKMKDAVLKYLHDFDPDAGTGVGEVFAGEGPVLEMLQPMNFRWAGMPGNIIDDNSMQQFIEYPLLLDEEFEEFFKDRTGWAMKKAIPRISGTLEPLKNFQYSFGNVNRLGRQVAGVFSEPGFRAMVEKLWKLNDFYNEYQVKADEFRDEVEAAGYPIYQGGGAGVPFDHYSDFLRGTILTMEDLYERPEDIQRYIDELLPVTLEALRSAKGINAGKHVFMALHKGFDTFLNDDHYRKYYWKYLKQIIETIIESGKVPYIFCEGQYDRRLDCLAEVPPGKVLYYFEKVDMAVAKKKLGNIACIAGSFPSASLDRETPEQIRDKAKRLIDICAPGGGYIFMTSCGLGHCKQENVETLFETVKEYGLYK